MTTKQAYRFNRARGAFTHTPVNGHSLPEQRWSAQAGVPPGQPEIDQWLGELDNEQAIHQPRTWQDYKLYDLVNGGLPTLMTPSQVVEVYNPTGHLLTAGFLHSVFKSTSSDNTNRYYVIPLVPDQFLARIAEEGTRHAPGTWHTYLLYDIIAGGAIAATAPNITVAVYNPPDANYTIPSDTDQFVFQVRVTDYAFYWAVLPMPQFAHLVKKENQTNHAADTFDSYLGFRLNDAMPSMPTQLTGNEAFNPLCWNPTQVAIGWDQWCVAIPVDRSVVTPFSKYVVIPCRMEPCLELQQGPADGQIETSQSVGSTDTIIKLTKLSDAGDRYTKETDGTLTVEVNSPELRLHARVLFDLSFSAANEDLELHLEWQYTAAGTGTATTVATVWPFRSAASGSKQVTLDVDIYIEGAQVGDTIDLVASDPEDTATVTANSGIWDSPAAPVIQPQTLQCTGLAMTSEFGQTQAGQIIASGIATTSGFGAHGIPILAPAGIATTSEFGQHSVTQV